MRVSWIPSGQFENRMMPGRFFAFGVPTGKISKLFAVAGNKASFFYFLLYIRS